MVLRHPPPTHTRTQKKLLSALVSSPWNANFPSRIGWGTTPFNSNHITIHTNNEATSMDLFLKHREAFLASRSYSQGGETDEATSFTSIKRI